MSGREKNGNPRRGTKQFVGGRPMKLIFEKMIFDAEQERVLTDVQVLRVIKREFDIDTSDMDKPQVELFVNIVKRFIKNWNKFLVLDKEIKSIRKIKHVPICPDLMKLLEARYADLREGLHIQLTLVKPLACSAYQLPLPDFDEFDCEADFFEVLKRLESTRKQLEEITLSTEPVEAAGVANRNTEAELPPSSVKHVKPTLQVIINSIGVRVAISTKSLSYVRSTDRILTSERFNPNDDQKVPISEQTRQMQITEVKESTSENITKEKIFKSFAKWLKMDGVRNTEQETFLIAIIETMKKDMIAMDTLKLSAHFLRHLNNFPYHRIVKKKNESGEQSETYYIDEILSPKQKFSVLPSTMTAECKLKLEMSLECVPCETKYTGSKIVTRAIKHFRTKHNLARPIWTCTNCKKSFPMIQLAEKNWHHRCRKQRTN